MPCRTYFFMFVTAVFSLLAPAVHADDPDPTLQVLFVGVSPETGAPGPVPRDLPIIALDALPATLDAQQTVFAARLRASPVSTFVTTPSESHAQFEQFFSVARISLIATNDSYHIGLAGEEITLGEFTDRMSAVIAAFNPKNRRVGFVEIADPGDVFPGAIQDVQTALDGIGFDMTAVMIDAGADPATCTDAPQRALHYDVISGLADRAPFGDGNGISTAAEVEAYLGRALHRQVLRDPVCGPKYSLLIKSNNDPAQDLVAVTGRSGFAQMETQLDNEIFESMFLLQSTSADDVQAFLSNCLYCPNEPALVAHLRDMEERARAATLEADIWSRIQGDEAPERLSIYLENCTLCTFRPEVEAKLAEIDAKAQAYDAEAATFQTALIARDIATLRRYGDTCVACAFQDEARALVTEIEAEEAYKAETAALTQALDLGEIAPLQSYLDTCTICEGKADATAALDLAQRRVTFRDPCLALAAVPQLGGPRKLEAIDRARAQQVCANAAREFPGDGEIRTTLGRIAQAAGDFGAASAHYVAGMEAGTPSAFGLAAYSHYAPPQGEDIDLIAAEVLAQKGAAQDDWLSQEILTVLYSKDLVPGKTPKDAFDIAQNIADQGNPLAQFFVGYYYLTGTGVDPSDSDAETWLKKSVDQGYTHAFSFLAELHEKGTDGVPAPDRAADLYWTALLEGDPTATDRLTTQLGERDRDVVRLIQEKLREEGAYRGAVDGIPGPGTVAAIRRFSEALTEQG